MNVFGSVFARINIYIYICEEDKKLERSSPIGVLPPGALVPLTGFIEFTKFSQHADPVLTHRNYIPRNLGFIRRANFTIP